VIQDCPALPAVPPPLPPVGTGPAGFSPLERRILAFLLAMPFLLVALGLHFLERERAAAQLVEDARRLEYLLAEAEPGSDPTIEVTYVEVDGMEEARAKRFLGSPSIRVNGIDVEYGEREPDEYQSGTRYYNTPQGWKPYPHARPIASAIIEQQAKERR
jgi:hypothetical protein